MTDKAHRELAEVLHQIAGKVALSGYHCDLMSELYSDWRRIEAPVKMCHSTKQPRQEVLWVNYDLEEEIQCHIQQKSLNQLLTMSQPILPSQS
jgi:DNA adenine methylase